MDQSGESQEENLEIFSLSTLQGHYYSWDIRLATFSLALLALVTYYKRYHITRHVMDTPKCGGWINYLPVCLCCARDTPMKAIEDEVILLEMILTRIDVTVQEAMENVISEDSPDNKKMKEISTQTDFDVYSKFPPQSANNGTDEQLRQFNAIHGNKSGFNLSKTVSKLFKPKPSRSSSIIESHNEAPLVTPESESSPSHSKTDVEIEMSVRQPLLSQMDSKLDIKTEKTQQTFKATTGNRVEITADLHHT